MSFAAWEIGADDVPRFFQRDRDFLEKHLEGWIERDPSLLASDVRWVARQLTLPDGSRLDLLGLLRDGTWVIAELKPGPLGAGAVYQALHYFIQIGSMTDGELVDRVKSRGLSDAGTAAALDELAHDAGDAGRNYLLLVAGVGSGQVAQATAEALTRHGFNVPIRVVAFEVMRDSAGRRILVREVEEAAFEGSRAAAGRSLEDIREVAEDCGVGSGFETIRCLLREHGHSEQRRGRGLNVSLGSRLNWLWLRPVERAVYLEYLAANFPGLFGVDEARAAADLGENCVTAPPEEALERLKRWVEVVDGYRGVVPGDGEAVSS